MWLEQGLFWVPCIVMLAACTRSTFGFGDALVAMPLLMAVIAPESALVVAAGVGLCQGALMVWQERASLDLRLSANLLLGALLGVPCGLWGVHVLPASTLRMIVSVVLLAYATQGLLKVQLPAVKSKLWGVAAGFCSGFLGSSITISGPPVAIYGVMARWHPEKFRATLQGFFLPLSVLVVSGHVITGLWTAERVTLIGASLPAMLFGAWLGARCRRRISPKRFERALYVILIAFAAMLAHVA